MKKNFMEVLLIMGILSLLTSGCSGVKGTEGKGKKAVDNDSGITAFSFSYSNMRSGYEYNVKTENGRIYFIYENREYEEYGEMKLECDADLKTELEDLYKSCRLAEWDGFDKYNSKVLDGDSFGLKIEFSDGGKMSAHGSNAKPDGYKDFFDKMEKIMIPCRDRILEAKHREKVEKGVSGDLYSILVNFTQKGTSGRDSYNVLIQKESIRENNFSVEVKSDSGEFFPKGEYSTVRHVPDTDIDFDAVRKMADEYSLIEWDDFDKAAEDYNNSEWFQIALSFGSTESPLRISACGTEHPGHYEEFRKAFLTWLADTYMKVVE